MSSAPQRVQELLNEQQVQWRAIVELLKGVDCSSVLRGTYNFPSHTTLSTFWTGVFSKNPPKQVFDDLYSTTFIVEGDRAFNDLDEGGRVPLHRATGDCSDPAVVAHVLALTSTENLTAPDRFGQTPKFHLDRGPIARLPSHSSIAALFDSALADHAAFKNSYYPRVSVAAFAAHVSLDPRCLLRLDGEGNSLLERARLSDQEVDVVQFLENKLAIVRAVEEEFPGLGTDELRLRIQMWEDV